MLRFRIQRVSLLLLAACALAILLSAGHAIAQSDPNDVPLGDVARQLREKKPSGEPVIDDDNLTQVIREAQSVRSAELAGRSGPILTYVMAGESKGFQVSAPDATCSLSFNTNARALLSSQYAQMVLPASDLSKLTGPATMEGDALTVSVFNGTDWHISEIAVAVMIVRKNAPQDMSLSGGASGLDRANPALEQSEVRPEKKPDQTIIYRMRAAASPLTMAVFSAPLNLSIDPGDEWHWALVEAKGYPPQNYAAGASSTAAGTATLPSSPISPGLLAPLYQQADPLSQNPQ
jgi:hypothetical protein